MSKNYIVICLKDNKILNSDSLRYVCPELNIKLEFSVFLFNSTDKLVVTDVDGTITQSDIKVQASLLIEGHERFQKMFNQDKQIVQLLCQIITSI